MWHIAWYLDTTQKAEQRLNLAVAGDCNYWAYQTTLVSRPIAMHFPSAFIEVGVTTISEHLKVISNIYHEL